jgi:hypothetical protein
MILLPATPENLSAIHAFLEHEVLPEFRGVFSRIETMAEELLMNMFPTCLRNQGIRTPMTWNSSSRCPWNDSCLGLAPRGLACLFLAWMPGIGMAGEILGASVEITERIPHPAWQSVPVFHENRLDEMDVYALSPTAIHLRLPRMVPLEARAVFGTDGGKAAPVVSVGAVVSKIRPPKWTAFIHKAAHDYDVAPELIAAVIQVESAFQPRAISSKGAQGLMQLMPATGVSLGLADPFDPEANIRAGVRYLKAQLSRFSSLEEALAAYNAGPGNVIKYGGIPPFPETRDFVRRVKGQMAGDRNQKTED